MKKFAWVFFGILIASHLSSYRNVKINTLSQEISLPKRDLKRLEYLFHELIIHGSAGYTLLGNKPVSFECFFKPKFEWDLSCLWRAFFPSNIKKYYAWKTWEKYEHLFNKGDILIWSEPSPWIKHSELMIVANKKQIERVLRENKQDFALLQNLKEPKALFRESLQSYEGLLARISHTFQRKGGRDVMPDFKNREEVNILRILTTSEL